MEPRVSRSGLGFRPPWWGVLLAAAGCAAGIALGSWQTGRAAEKRAAGAAGQRVTLLGELLPQFTVFLENRVHHGKPGLLVVQALRIAGNRHVLVLRGWIAADPARAQPPAIRTPPGSTLLDGLRRERIPRAYEPGGAPRGWPARQNVTIEEFAAWSGLALEPWVLEQHSALEDGLARDWPPPDLGADKHAAYALQWYSLALLSVVLLVVLGFRREKPSS